MLLIKLIAKKFIGCFLYQIPKNFMIYAREKEGFSWFLKRVSGTKHRKKKSRKNNNISLCSLLPLSSYIFVIFYRYYSAKFQKFNEQGIKKKYEKLLKICNIAIFFSKLVVHI